MNLTPMLQSMDAWETYLCAPEGAATLRFLYGEDHATQAARYRRALRGFAQRFGEHPVALLSAPGRTELCGNHTDHQHGTCSPLRFRSISSPPRVPTGRTLCAFSPRAMGNPPPRFQA